ncbi:MAG: ABC transporter substrate-binding protein, partial [Proteobacteria bacterium]|nr:ABC transporter substrate-binding protein [Pseudomonadota bacterium]
MRGTRGIGKVAQRVARAAVAISIAASSILPAAMPAAAQAGPYAGVELNVLTGVGPQIAEPLARRGKEWAEANGAKVNVVTVPFNEIYSKMLTDVYTRTNAFDIFVFAPQW